MDFGPRADNDVAVDSREALRHQLTLLMTAYALGGCCRVDAGQPHPGGLQIMLAPWDTMLNYVDFVMDSVASHPGPELESVAWGVRGDAQSRAHWVHLCRRPSKDASPRLTLGEAVVQTYNDKASVWIVPAPAVPMVMHDRRSTPPAEKRSTPSDAAGQSSERKRVKLPAGTSVLQHIGGKPICKPWTDGRGCDGHCEKAHACDIKDCRAPWSHPRTGHRF